MTDTVEVTITVDRQTLRDLLCTAVEGGANYWARFDQATRTEDLNYLSVCVTEHDASGDTVVSRVVTADDLATGLSRLAHASFPAAKQHLADALGDHDAGTADVVLQMTVFGDVVYS